MAYHSFLLHKAAGVAVKTAGFAREELLLGLLVVGGLGAFGGIVGAPWRGWLASDQSQAAGLVRKIEAANLKFYQEYGYWPHETTDGSPAANVLVLMDKSAATALYISGSRYHPLIEADMQVDGDGSKVVRHRYGSGGTVREVALEHQDNARDKADGDYRYVITLDNLTMAQARKLDEEIDGTFAPEAGRMRITYLGDKAVARYLANPTLSMVAAK